MRRFVTQGLAFISLQAKQINILCRIAFYGWMLGNKSKKMRFIKLIIYGLAILQNLWMEGNLGCFGPALFYI